MNKIDLKNRIKELELLLKQKDDLIYSQQQFINSKEPTYLTTTDFCPMGGNHDYPLPWHSISTPNCKKCGHKGINHEITFYTGTPTTVSNNTVINDNTITSNGSKNISK